MVTAKFVSHYVLLNKNKLQKKKKEQWGGKLGIQHIRSLGFQTGFWPSFRSTWGLHTYFSDSIMTSVFILFYFIFISFCLHEQRLFPICCVMQWPKVLKHPLEQSPHSQCCWGHWWLWLQAPAIPEPPGQPWRGENPSRLSIGPPRAEGEASEDTFSTL